MELYKRRDQKPDDPQLTIGMHVMEVATKADKLQAAKELIEVSDEEIDYLIEMLDAFDNNFEIESKRKRFKRNHIRNFISSLFEEKKKCKP